MLKGQKYAVGLYLTCGYEGMHKELLYIYKNKKMVNDQCENSQHGQHKFKSMQWHCA